MKRIVFFLLVLSQTVTAQIVNIPDATFKAYLVAKTFTINTNGDGEIQVAEASAFTGTINVSLYGVSDLTGIEAFTALTQLYCVKTLLTSLDVSKNTALTYLDCGGSDLTSLNVSGCTALTQLHCSYNDLTSLDVSNNTVLTYLDCGVNFLTSLDVRNMNNINMTSFYAWGNPLLYCILVDDTAYSNANWLNKDSTAVYSNDCTVDIEDNEPTQPTITTYNNTITIAGAEGKASIYNLLGQEVAKASLPASIRVESGVYLVRVKSGGKVVTKKVVVGFR
ncbi:MAG: T9SS type A sorting domain-containing protein [Bacteroidetes bacterium]|nr:T9SS type A sorting domain-containing protein [Bacteroidota bacterium]